MDKTDVSMRQFCHCMEDFPVQIPFGYVVLRSLSRSSPVYLCRENASDRLLVIKFTQRKFEDQFQREVRALADLDGFEAAPNLYFASGSKSGTDALDNDPEAYALHVGMQYSVGRPLLEWCGQGKSRFPEGLRDSLFQKLRTLHQKWGYAHGDLSPKNILVHDDGRITFIDWEFSQKLSDQTLSTYMKFRGTFGFGQRPECGSMAQKDIKALEACFQFMTTDGERNGFKQLASRFD